MKLFGSAVMLAAFAAAIFIYFSRERATAIPARPPMAAKASPGSDCPQCAQLSQRIDALQQNLVAMKSQLASQQSQSAAPHAGNAAKPPDSPNDLSDVAVMRAADAERHREYMSGIAQSFTAERIDSAWASYASTRIGTTLDRDEVLRSVARNLECHQQTCRLELRDDASGNLSSHMPLLAIGLAEVFPTIAAERVEQGSNGSAMVLYLSKQPPPTAASK